MTAPYLVPCLVTLRAEFNELAPGRDKGADGWIGDAAHAARVSDHNPDAAGRVLAVDIDATGPWPFDFSAAIEELRGDERLEYIIWNRRICTRDTGWTWRPYTGSSDPHTGHAHFSARHDHTKNNVTAPWGLIDWADDMTPEELLAYDAVPNLYGDAKTNPNVTVKTALKAAVSADVKASSLESQVKALQAQVTKVEATLAEILTAVKPPAE